MNDLFLALTFLFYATLGAIARALFGIYKAYTSLIDFRLDKKRVAIEIVSSIYFGTIGTLLLKEISKFDYSLTIVAFLAGLFGPDILVLLSRRLGMTKSLQIIVSEEQIAYAGLNARQINVLKFLKNRERITNEIYQKLNQTNRNIAKRDLGKLVRMGKIKKKGKGKSVYYEKIR